VGSAVTLPPALALASGDALFCSIGNGAADLCFGAGIANSSPNFSFKALTKLGALVESAVLIVAVDAPPSNLSKAVVKALRDSQI